MINKTRLILMLPIIFIAFCIDMLVGDFATGVKTSVKDKYKQHKKLFISEWGINHV